MGVRNLALAVSNELYAQYQRAYITGYSLTILVIALLCILATLVIFRGIRRTLIYQPEDSPLDDDSAEEERNDQLAVQIKRIG